MHRIILIRIGLYFVLKITMITQLNIHSATFLIEFLVSLQFTYEEYIIRKYNVSPYTDYI